MVDLPLYELTVHQNSRAFVSQSYSKFGGYDADSLNLPGIKVPRFDISILYNRVNHEFSIPLA